MNKPKVTVLMPAYNAAAYIKEAIDSVLQQSFSDFELLIVNDGSTDETELIVRSYADNRIVLINQQNGGVSAALNTGLEHARADYIARFDADDICYPQRLQVQYHFMLENPQFIITGSDADYMDSDGNHLFHFHNEAYTAEAIKQQVRRSCPFIHSSVMYKKDVVLQLGGYQVHAHTFEDHLLWTKAVKAGESCNIKQSLIKVRFNPASVTIDEKWRDKRFVEIKRKALDTGNITEEEGNELKNIIKAQDTGKYKEASYHALIGKKFLWNNYEGAKARQNFAKAIRLQPFKGVNYILYLFSFMPSFINTWLYRLVKRKVH